MTGQNQKRSRIFLGAIMALLLAGKIGMAQETLRLTNNKPGDSKPVVLYADDIATWTENGQRIILLKGKVLVEHGVVTTRAQRAVAFVDEGRYRQTRILRVDVYAEGEVRVENGPDARTGPKALVDLNTRGDLKLKAHGRPIVQQPQSTDPLYLRAMSERVPAAPPAAAPAPIAPVPNSTAKPGPAPVLQQTGYQPGMVDSAIVPAQAILPAPGPTAPPTLQPGPSPVEQAPALPLLQPPVTGGTAGPPRDAGGVPIPAPYVPGQPPPAPRPGVPPGAGAAAPGPPGSGPPRVLNIRPRYSGPFQTQSFPLPSGEQAIVATGGIILTVSNDQRVGMLDIEADKLVFWTRGNTNQVFEGMKGPQGQQTRELEFYLAGNVEIRQKSQRSRGNQESRIMRADEVFYDVNRNVAVAVAADLEFRNRRIPDPIHMRADELLQTSADTFEVIKGDVSASKLPSDPGVKIEFQNATLESKRVPRRGLFGQVTDRRTGEALIDQELMFKGRNVFLEVEDVPIFYFPYLAGNAADPLGPLESIQIGFNRIFGFQFGASFNVYDIFGIDPYPGTRWRWDVDYMSARGPGTGTNFDYAGKDFFGVPSAYAGMVKAWGLLDQGDDVLGGGRGANDNHPNQRGRFTWRQNWWDLPQGFTVQNQLSALSDHNFLEQYYKQEFDFEINQETFVYVKQQQNNWAWTVLAQPHIRYWVSESEWLPRGDGYLIGQSFFNLFTYNTHVSAGYAELFPAKTQPEPTPGPPPPGPVTTVRLNTGRFDWGQELSMPLPLGPVKFVPYGVLDLTQYTQDLTGEERGRFYGGGGARASMPLTRLYPSIQSELWNLNGINHKVVFSGNYFIAHSDTPFSRLPQLDRLNDDATDQALRDITPQQPFINPRYGVQLQTNPLYNIQSYAIRRLVDTRIDTLDTIEVFQADIRQRWQTKRGYPGMQHIIDYITLDVSSSFFPHPERDNFGSDVAFVEYNAIWNVGDRNGFVSSAYIDPIEGGNGPKEWTVGAFLNRPDRTNFFLGYREIQPLQSRAVTGSASYVFSPKYAVTGYTVYDFGTSQSLSNSLVLTRMGSDLQISLGITYNAMQNNFGMIFQIVPNLLPTAGRIPGLPVIGQSPFRN
ncbi:MAG: hypothetical protein K2R98_30750 [Gemmataceae bacterium]|nr:hypothetical protein [Gemmataceae bacterium]